MSDHYRLQCHRFVVDLLSISVNPVPQSAVSLYVRGAIRYVTCDEDSKLSPNVGNSFATTSGHCCRSVHHLFLLRPRAQNYV